MKAALWLAFAALAASAADNTLTPEEARAGWKLLFDGSSFTGWLDPARKDRPGDAWMIENGCFKTRLHPVIEEDLISAESYGDFELKFDWRIAPGGNSGVKYRIQRTVFVDPTRNPGNVPFEAQLGREIAQHLSDRRQLAPGAHGFEYVVGFEFQLIDDTKHPDAKFATHTTGALYSMLAPIAHPAHPAGEWNNARLVVRGSHVEHWINGVKVLDGSLDDPAALAGPEKRWSPAPAIRDALVHPKPTGPVSLQHHGDEVWFKNIKIKIFAANERK